MGDNILAASLVLLVGFLWSSWFVGVQCNNGLLRVRRQGDGSSSPLPTFPDVAIERMDIPAPAPSPSVNTTVQPLDNNSTLTHTGDEEDSSAVTVIIVVVILVLIVLSAVGVFIFIQMRKRRLADYEKKTKIQMSSTGNAGVYIDLTDTTQQLEPADKPIESPETEKLNKEED